MAEGGGGTIAALSSAQRYPDDDDFAVTGMSSYLTRHTFAQMWIWQATHKDAASFHPARQVPRCCTTRCSRRPTRFDGLKDGVVGDPLACRFNPAVVQCKEGATASCLTPPQVEAARKSIRAQRHARTGAGSTRRSIRGASWMGTARRRRSAAGIPVEFFKFYVLRDPAWDYRTRSLRYDSDVAASTARDQPVSAVIRISALLRTRREALSWTAGTTRRAAKGGNRLLHRVVAAVGERQTRESMRFFMVPGMGHGPGTAGGENFDFDALSLIEQWKEHGVAPDRLIVGHYKDGKRVGARLVCQYPRVAVYKGGALDTEIRPASIAGRSRGPRSSGHVLGSCIVED